MKLVLIAIGLTLSCIWAEEKYTDKYDSLNIDEVIANKRLLNAYNKCVLDQGKCTSEGRELKSHIAEGLKTGCAKCTDAQHKGMRKVIKHLMTHDKNVWRQMVEKYDPKRVYSTKYEKELKSLY
ncbi:ejaculatory bulb-specific protein 3-like [Hyposmocoma kahamanoa]|uniref:ejaculatory bulb-specific protein 3-like n=1 Tax=Hyposmocoma kahamanoa TaxID=1477025 RepID=UPI000E6D5EEE|nr:ejaculatory bulb-specific protein 3-like [Hyposmocoma kahamanoa]